MSNIFVHHAVVSHHANTSQSILSAPKTQPKVYSMTDSKMTTHAALQETVKWSGILLLVPTCKPGAMTRLPTSGMKKNPDITTMASHTHTAQSWGIRGLTLLCLFHRTQLRRRYTQEQKYGRVNNSWNEMNVRSLNCCRLSPWIWGDLFCLQISQTAGRTYNRVASAFQGTRSNVTNEWKIKLWLS